jgi:serine/threonine protein kinase
MAPSRRRQRASAASLGFLLLLYAISVSSLLPAVGAQSTTFTNVVGGKEFQTFSFPAFVGSQATFSGNLTFSGNASVSNSALQITPDTRNDPGTYLVNKAGRIMFTRPYVLWASNSSNATAADGRRVASFSTVFKINLFRANDSVKGEGIAFVIASDGGVDPPPGSVGEYLGLTNASTDGSAANGFAAVEFDSLKQAYDIDDNHVGIDVNGVRSKAAASLTPFGIELAPRPNNTSTDDGSNMVWVEYNGTSRHMWVYMARNGSNRPATPVLDTALDLSTVLLGKKAYFGFTASTGVAYQLNCVHMWNMTVEILPGSPSSKTFSGWKLGLTIGVCAAALALGLFAGLYIRSRRRRIRDDPNSLFHSSIDLTSMAGVPKEYDYKELRKGTNNFDEKMKLGQGGYGVVYRATVLGEQGQTVDVAVKQFSGANTKGQEDFLAELSIINLLRHRNLVKLLGWCHQNGVLLLVYDYMPNGSLDRHLFGGPESPILTWDQRYKVVAGVASALNYLHHEYDQRVIHRDIKPSNIMLDGAFNARLGDFGLARALESDKTSYTDKIGVPGTLGYIAPECFHTGRATRESDVFGLGAVILEIVSGRRVSCSNPAGCSQLLEGVWQLHGAGKGRVLEAVDRRLADGEFDEGDAERLLLLGLACSHPNPGERPTARAIVHILARSQQPPEVPASKPAFMWPVQRVAAAGEDGEMLTSGVSTAMTSSSSYSYCASSAGWTTQNYLLSRDHDLTTDRDASTL